MQAASSRRRRHDAKPRVTHRSVAFSFPADLRSPHVRCLLPLCFCADPLRAARYASLIVPVVPVVIVEPVLVVVVVVAAAGPSAWWGVQRQMAEDGQRQRQRQRLRLRRGLERASECACVHARMENPNSTSEAGLSACKLGAAGRHARHGGTAGGTGVRCGAFARVALRPSGEARPGPGPGPRASGKAPAPRPRTQPLLSCPARVTARSRLVAAAGSGSARNPAQRSVHGGNTERAPLPAACCMLPAGCRGVLGAGYTERRPGARRQLPHGARVHHAANHSHARQPRHDRPPHHRRIDLGSRSWAMGRPDQPSLDRLHRLGTRPEPPSRRAANSEPPAPPRLPRSRSAETAKHARCAPPASRGVDSIRGEPRTLAVDGGPWTMHHAPCTMDDALAAWASMPCMPSGCVTRTRTVGGPGPGMVDGTLDAEVPAKPGVPSSADVRVPGLELVDPAIARSVVLERLGRGHGVLDIWNPRPAEPSHAHSQQAAACSGMGAYWRRAPHARARKRTGSGMFWRPWRPLSLEPRASRLASPAPVQPQRGSTLAPACGDALLSMSHVPNVSRDCASALNGAYQVTEAGLRHLQRASNAEERSPPSTQAQRWDWAAVPEPRPRPDAGRRLVRPRAPIPNLGRDRQSAYRQGRQQPSGQRSRGRPGRFLRTCARLEVRSAPRAWRRRQAPRRTQSRRAAQQPSGRQASGFNGHRRQRRRRRPARPAAARLRPGVHGLAGGRGTWDEGRRRARQTQARAVAR